MSSNVFLRIRAYNVGFGDCFLITLMDEKDRFDTLVDFGKHHGCSVSAEFYEDVKRDLREQFGPKKRNNQLDLLILTHTHDDHMNGLLLEKGQWRIFCPEPKRIWVPAKCGLGYTGSTKPVLNHYVRCFQSLLTSPDATKLLTNLVTQPKPSPLERFSKIYLTAKSKVSFVHTMTPLANLGLSTSKMKFEVLYPRPPESEIALSILVLVPPYEIEKAGVESECVETLVEEFKAYDFRKGYDLPPFPEKLYQTIEKLAEIACGENSEHISVPDIEKICKFLKSIKGQIDRERIRKSLELLAKALNDDTIVFRIDWEGNVLLFMGDFGEDWSLLDAGLKELDFLKVPHHGSRYSIPQDHILDTILPGQQNNTCGQPIAIIPTCAPVGHAPSCMKDVVPTEFSNTLSERAVVFRTSQIRHPQIYQDFIISPK